MTELITVIRQALRDVAEFSRVFSGVTLRQYQAAPARAIVHSVINRLGLSFVVMFPRQSGKNELQAQLETYLLCLFQGLPAEMVKISPTWKPQSLNAMRRLERVLNRNLIASARWQKESGYAYRLGSARLYFLSGSAETNIVGATANLLLECDEAQDVRVDKWDKDIAPMAASTNATRVFYGTAWTADTLLARELRLSRQAEAQDGIQRVFTLSADEVGREVPAYARHVAEQVARLGRWHPLVRTQYFCEEIDGEAGMFPPARLALMRGSHAPLDAPEAGKTYVMALDVAGGDETLTADLRLERPASRRDASALTIAEVDFSTLAIEGVAAPTYRVRQRRVWRDAGQAELFAQARAMIELWSPRYIVVDATGIGAGIASFLAKRYPAAVTPFVFTLKSKSDLGWRFINAIESGRYQEPAADPQDALASEFWRQCARCQMTLLPGPGKLMRWGAPEGGEAVHDDLVVSAALLTALDAQPWGMALSQVIPQDDPFAAMKDAF